MRWENTPGGWGWGEGLRAWSSSEPSVDPGWFCISRVASGGCWFLLDRFSVCEVDKVETLFSRCSDGCAMLSTLSVAENHFDSIFLLLL